MGDFGAISRFINFAVAFAPFCPISYHVQIRLDSENKRFLKESAKKNSRSVVREANYLFAEIRRERQQLPKVPIKTPRP
jgi:hypothetical protein